MKLLYIACMYLLGCSITAKPQSDDLSNHSGSPIDEDNRDQNNSDYKNACTNPDHILITVNGESSWIEVPVLCNTEPYQDKGDPQDIKNPYDSHVQSNPTQ